MHSEVTVYMQGEWRVLDKETATVHCRSGRTHQARFLYISNGQLHPLQTSHVLRELRALDAGEPSRISLSVNTRLLNSPSFRHVRPFHKHNNYHGRDRRTTRTVDASMQVSCRRLDTCSTSAADGVQTAAQENGPATFSMEARHLSKRREKQVPPLKQSDNVKQNVCPSKRKEEKPTSPTKHTNIQSGTEDNVLIKLQAKTKHKGRVCGAPSHERRLYVADSDVTALREYIANIFDDDFLYKFDSDELFQHRLLHKINPLVCVERSPRIAEILASEDDDSLKDRVGMLHRCRVGDVSPERNRRGREYSQLEDRAYSQLEDRAIETWVSAGGATRESRVSGNLIWQQLQREYAALAGRSRSWHSLRNRYLRHIRPTRRRRDAPPAPAPVSAALTVSSQRSRGRSRRCDPAPAPAAAAQQSSAADARNSHVSESAPALRRSARRLETPPAPRRRRLYNHKADMC